MIYQTQVALALDSPNMDIRAPDYFIQRKHFNFFNKIWYSEFMKKYNPLHEYRSYTTLQRQKSANWYGFAPQKTWVDGILDYTYNKHNTLTIGHFHMHENRKNKPFQSMNGSDGTKRQLIAPSYVESYLPKGCEREVNAYKKCRKESGMPCTEMKVSIVEVCPKWALELLREGKRLRMKATVIDNNTYRRAMEVSPWNRNRSLSDMKDKNSHLRKIRSDGYWYDDRYDPTKYPSPDSNDNANLDEGIVYNDIIGGNNVEKIYAERNKYMAENE